MHAVVEASHQLTEIFAQMYDEAYRPPPKKSVETESEREARHRMDRFHVRIETKCLLDWVRQSPHLPNKVRVEKILQEILLLVPSAGLREDEEEDEERRAAIGDH